jgi:hypothetical protein
MKNILQKFRYNYLILLLPFLFVFAHPTYVSTTTLKYNYDQKSIEITCKMFANDLEEALKKNLNTKVDVLNPGNKKAVEDMISEYIKNRLSITLNGKPATFNFIGYEKDSDQAVSFLEITGVEVPQTFEIDNKLLYDHFKGQMNIVNVEVNGKKQSSKVTNPESKMKFTVGAATPAKKTGTKAKK